jgi:glycosyltransferase involved in cell wall biosynthesis
MKRLGIIIPTKNEAEFLPVLLESISRQTFRDYEVVVADADSKDKTRDIARKAGCKVVQGGLPDIARNNGARACASPLLCFIDADIKLPHPRFLEQALEEMDARGLDVAGTLQRPIPIGKKYRDFLYRGFYGVANLGMSMSENGKCPFMQVMMFVKRDAFNAVGGFPPLSFAEDSALAKTLVTEKYKFGILRDPGKVLISPRRLEDRGFYTMSLRYAAYNVMRMFGHEFERGKTKIKYH